MKRTDQEIIFDKYERKGPYHWRLYEDTTYNYYKAIVKFVVECVPFQSTVLDMGCGDGLISYVVAKEKACRVIGVDNNLKAIHLASKLNGDTQNEFLHRSVYDSCGDGFDVVLMVDILEHVRKPFALMENVRKSLRRGGSLILSTPLYEEGKILDIYHVKEYTEQEIHDLMRPCFTLREKRLLKFHEINFLSSWTRTADSSDISYSFS